MCVSPVRKGSPNTRLISPRCSLSSGQVAGALAALNQGYPAWRLRARPEVPDSHLGPGVTTILPPCLRRDVLPRRLLYSQECRLPPLRGGWPLTGEETREQPPGVTVLRKLLAVFVAEKMCFWARATVRKDGAPMEMDAVLHNDQRGRDQVGPAQEGVMGGFPVWL